jgi:hypothetical protein
MSGETLEDYFRHLNLDETRRNFLESIKEGKQEENGIEEYKNNNKNTDIFSVLWHAGFVIMNTKLMLIS